MTVSETFVRQPYSPLIHAVHNVAALPTVLSASNHEFMSARWHTTSMCTYSIVSKHALTQTHALICVHTQRNSEVYTHRHTRGVIP